MSQFIESICFRDRAYHLLDIHQERVNMTFEIQFPGTKPLVLRDILPQLDSQQKQKIRLQYTANDYTVEVQEYVQKTIGSLKIVEDNQIVYPLKSANRIHLDHLLHQKGTCDEVIIVKNDRVTDSSYSNLIFWDGLKWLTPSTYLLNGVKRQSLLRKNLISEVKISVSDITHFEKIGLINAMLDPDELSINTNKIIT